MYLTRLLAFGYYAVCALPCTRFLGTLLCGALHIYTALIEAFCIGNSKRYPVEQGCPNQKRAFRVNTRYFCCSFILLAMMPTTGWQNFFLHSLIHGGAVIRAPPYNIKRLKPMFRELGRSATPEQHNFLLLGNSAKVSTNSFPGYWILRKFNSHIQHTGWCFMDCGILKYTMDNRDTTFFNYIITIIIIIIILKSASHVIFLSTSDVTFAS